MKRTPLYVYLLAAAAAKLLQSCLTLYNRIDGSPPGSSISGILQARTRVGCHFLLQCMKVRSESEVTQSWPTLGHPMDCSLPGSSIHGIFQARVLEWAAIAFSFISLRSYKSILFCYLLILQLIIIKLENTLLNLQSDCAIFGHNYNFIEKAL